jgi:hypothetical protein
MCSVFCSRCGRCICGGVSVSARLTSVVTLSRQWVVDYGKHPLVRKTGYSDTWITSGLPATVQNSQIRNFLRPQCSLSALAICAKRV